MTKGQGAELLVFWEDKLAAAKAAVGGAKKLWEGAGGGGGERVFLMSPKRRAEPKRETCGKKHDKTGGKVAINVVSWFLRDFHLTGGRRKREEKYRARPQTKRRRRKETLGREREGGGGGDGADRGCSQGRRTPQPIEQF